MSTSSLEKLTPLQHRARDVGITMTAAALHALGIKKWETATDEQCYAVIADHEINAENQQQQVQAKPATGVEAALGRLAKAQHLCTDLANANRLKRTFGKRIISVGGEFFGWTGTHWARAVNGEAHQYAGNLSQIVGKETKVARDEADAALGKWESTITPEQRAMATLHPRKHPLPEMPEHVVALDKAASALEAWIKECEMKYRKDAALGWLRETHTLDPSKLDRDPWLFNCLNGTIDIRTGELRPHNPDDLITFCAQVRYNSDAKAPWFERFISEVVETGEPVAKFLQRWYGSALTGVVREHHLVILWGKGRNGKGALNRTIEHVLGEYAGTAPQHLLADNGRGNERHETEIMTLRGRRLVTAHEPDKGAVLREGFVKQMTGGDKLTGRFMRKDHVSFDPTHKAQLLTNYKPDVHGQDNGIWGRLLLVNFPNKYGSVEDVAAGKATHPVDLALEERLREEREGILNWLIQGALDWRRKGLSPPEAVMKASREYQSEQDRIGEFIRERCVIDRAARAEITGSPEGLYLAYQGWCRENGFSPLGSGKFKQEILLRPGIQNDTWNEGKKGAGRRTKRGVSGIRLGSEELPDEPDAPAPVAAAPSKPKPAPAESVVAVPAPAWEDGPISEPTPQPNGNGASHEDLAVEFERRVALFKGLKVGNTNIGQVTAECFAVVFPSIEALGDATVEELIAAKSKGKPLPKAGAEQLQQCARDAVTISTQEKSATAIENGGISHVGTTQ